MLGEQELSCRDFASAQGLDVVKVFAEYSSGISPNRPELKQLLSFCSDAQNKIAVVVTADAARLARDAALLAALLRHLAQQRIQVVFQEACGSTELLTLQALSKSYVG